MPRNINPWGFSESVIFIFFFFSLSRFSFRLLTSVSLFASHLCVFCRMEFGSMREGKKLAKSDFDVSRKILCFWLVELDEITRNHGSPTSFGTVRIVQIWQAYTHTWKNVTLVEEWCFDFVNINVNQFGIIILIHILIKIIV